MENRKRQVQEFLSTTQGNGRSLLTQSVPNGAVVALTTTAPIVDPLPGTPAPLISSSAPSPESPNSVALSSSAATSASEVGV